jgi:hypothetical protein
MRRRCCKVVLLEIQATNTIVFSTGFTLRDCRGAPSQCCKTPSSAVAVLQASRRQRHLHAASPPLGIAISAARGATVLRWVSSPATS